MGSYRPAPGRWCIVCRRRRNEGVRVLGGFLCAGCQSNIACADVNDQSYSRVLRGVRRMLIASDLDKTTTLQPRVVLLGPEQPLN